MWVGDNSALLQMVTFQVTKMITFWDKVCKWNNLLVKHTLARRSYLSWTVWSGRIFAIISGHLWLQRKMVNKSLDSSEHDILYVRVESEKEMGVNSLFKLTRVIQAANTNYSWGEIERVYTECHSWVQF